MLAPDKRQFVLSLRDVQKLDRYLAREWGIRCRSMSEDEWHWELQEEVGIAAYDRFLDQHNDYSQKSMEGQLTATVSGAYYDAISKQPYAGFIHSQKRPSILDSAAMVQNIARQIRLSGPLLDIGCNIGYHGIWYATTLDVKVLGIDVDRSSVNEANRFAQKKRAQARFEVADLCSFTSTDKFQLISAIDVLRLSGSEEANALVQLGALLPDRGLLIAQWHNSILHWKDQLLRLILSEARWTIESRTN